MEIFAKFIGADYLRTYVSEFSKASIRPGIGALEQAKVSVRNVHVTYSQSIRMKNT